MQPVLVIAVSHQPIGKCLWKAEDRLQRANFVTHKTLRAGFTGLSVCSGGPIAEGVMRQINKLDVCTLGSLRFSCRSRISSRPTYPLQRE
jgi:hypothetical protein